eukprot:683706-Rhodomonas_salina.1
MFVFTCAGVTVTKAVSDRKVSAVVEELGDAERVPSPLLSYALATQRPVLTKHMVQALFKLDSHPQICAAHDCLLYTSDAADDM